MDLISMISNRIKSNENVESDDYKGMYTESTPVKVEPNSNKEEVVENPKIPTPPDTDKLPPRRDYSKDYSRDELGKYKVGEDAKRVVNTLNELPDRMIDTLKREFSYANSSLANLVNKPLQTVNSLLGVRRVEFNKNIKTHGLFYWNTLNLKNNYDVQSAPLRKKPIPDTRKESVVRDRGRGDGHGRGEHKWDITNDFLWDTRYELNADKHLGPYFKGHADVSLFEGRIDRFYDFEIYAPSELTKKGLPAVPKAASGLSVDISANLNSIKTIELTSGDTLNLGDYGSVAKSIKMTNNIASLTTEIFETEDIAVRKWLKEYVKYMYGDDPTPLVHRSIYLGYYYLTYYYLNIDRSVIEERTFWAVPTFDLSYATSESYKSFNIEWQCIGESATRGG
jgi:hypothetical protein